MGRTTDDEVCEKIRALRTPDDFSPDKWREFQDLVIWLLRRWYEPRRIEIKNQEKEGPDGGKDAYFEVRFLEDGPEALGVDVKCWFEAKARKRAIGHAAFGRTFIAALLECVNKVVVISNQHYTDGFRQDMAALAKTRGLVTSLIDGEEFLALLREQCLSPPRHAVPRSADWPADVEPRVDGLAITAGLTTGPGASTGEAGQIIELKDNSTCCLCVDVEATRVGRMRVDASVTVRPGCGVRVGRNSRQQILELAGTARGRLVIPLDIGNAGSFRLGKDIMLVIACAAAPLPMQLGCDTVQRTIPLAHHLPVSQSTVLRRLERVVGDWLGDQVVRPAVLVAPGGVGKSNLIGKARSFWFDAEPAEIMVDGATSDTPERLFAAILRPIFPSIGSLDFNRALRQSLVAWLVARGATVPDAEGFADTIFRADAAKHQTVTPVHAEILANVLLFSASRRKTVLIVENLHRLSPTARGLLARTFDTLHERSSANLLILAATRPPGEAPVGRRGGGLSVAFDEVLRTVETLPLELPSETDAMTMLREAVAGLNDGDARNVIRQVGRSPFNLKEAVLFLQAKGEITALAEGSGRYRVADGRIAHRRILGGEAELEDATRKRLGLLRQRWQKQAAWLEGFLVAAAVLNEPFDPRLCLSAARGPKALPAALRRELVLYDVLASRGAGLYGLSHDLIAESCLAETDRLLAADIAGALLSLFDRQELAPDVAVRADNPEQIAATAPFRQAKLALIAGQAERCDMLAATAAREAESRSRFLDAALSHFLRVNAVDPIMAVDWILPIRIFEATLADPGVERFGRSHAPIGTGRGAAALVLDRLAAASRCLLQAGVVDNDAFANLLTEGVMLARTQGFPAERATFRGMQARLALEVEDFRACLAACGEAMADLSGLGPVERAAVQDDESTVLCSICLAHRHLGDHVSAHAALETFVTFERRTGRLPPGTLECVRLALDGYIDFYADPQLTYEKWARAADGLEERNDALMMEYLIGSGYISLLTDRMAEAEDRLNRAGIIGKNTQAYSQTSRLHLNLANLALVRRDGDTAVAHASEAWIKASGLRNLRRELRAEATYANAMEAIGNLDNARHHDIRAMSLLRRRADAERSLGHHAPWMRQRHVMPAVNARLRERRRGGPPADSLFRCFTEIEIGVIDTLADQVVTAALSGPLGYHCKAIGPRLPRFIVTE